MHAPHLIRFPFTARESPPFHTKPDYRKLSSRRFPITLNAPYIHPRRRIPPRRPVTTSHRAPSTSSRSTHAHSPPSSRTMPLPQFPELPRALESLQSTLIALFCLVFVVLPLLWAGFIISFIWIIGQLAEAVRQQEEDVRLDNKSTVIPPAAVPTGRSSTRSPLPRRTKSGSGSGRYRVSGNGRCLRSLIR